MIGKSTGTATGTKRRGSRPALGCLAAVIFLAWSSVCAAAIVNPSFETTYAGLPWPRPLPSGWGRADHPAFNSYCTSMWRTAGAQSAGLFSRLGYPVNPGNYQGFHQFVDLTGVSSIQFDVRLAGYPSGTFEHFEASFLVDGTPLWTKTKGGEHLNQQVNVSGMAGWHRIEMRITALESGQFTEAYWTQWDNLQLAEGPATIKAVVDLDPGTLNLGSNGKWITCYIELGEGFEVSAIEGATVKLGDIPAHMGDEGWATSTRSNENIVDHDGDGVMERMVKFDRSAVQAIVRPPQATVTVTGTVSGIPFEGAATINVIDKGPKQK
jgi:hypothetical protein